MEGYYCADGDKDKKQTINRFDTKNKISAAHLYFLSKRIGYTVSVNCRSDKENIFRLTCSQTLRKLSYEIKKIYPLREVNTEGEFVYDIETELGTFNGGIGDIVLKNTDSIFVYP
jgi:hypothetical protein